jgi:hypothetical protein
MRSSEEDRRLLIFKNSIFKKLRTRRLKSSLLNTSPGLRVKNNGNLRKTSGARKIWLGLI